MAYAYIPSNFVPYCKKCMSHLNYVITNDGIKIARCCGILYEYGTKKVVGDNKGDT